MLRRMSTCRMRTSSKAGGIGQARVNVEEGGGERELGAGGAGGPAPEHAAVCRVPVRT